MPLTLLTLCVFLTGCAAPSAVISQPSGCLDRVRHGKHSHLTRDGVEIPNDLMAATAGDPAAQKLVARAKNLDTATLVFFAAAPSFLISAIATALAQPSDPRQTWPDTAIPLLIGGEGLSIAMSISLILAAGFQERAAIERYNRDAGCR